MNFLAGIKRLRGNESESLNEVPFYFPDPHAPWQRGPHVRQEIRYLARGVSGAPKEMQLRRWQLIDEKEKQAETKVDYLQIFEFNRDDHRGTITIIHR
ncbi:DUF960 family protein [Enterococcus raffinosus]|uniref:DUF960 family protein n=1 Tax=Enterococcus raffinosus TaxID=71452 RepID=UPI001C43FA39|nr:DUF960 family protein [Enterococcus raffinosus]MDT2570507.1 DUF960 family protein [Enterococcus raffinosus]QXJ60830.1 hypothetical protein J9537_18025 [Enterococcus raffinosus]